MAITQIYGIRLKLANRSILTLVFYVVEEGTAMRPIFGSCYSGSEFEAVGRAWTYTTVYRLL